MGINILRRVFLSTDGEDDDMKKAVYGLWFIVYSLIFVVSVSCFTNISCAQREGIVDRDKAPDFTLEDVNGKNVNLSETVSKSSATLLVFWASWCPYCREEIPDLIRLNSNYKNKGLKILAIDIGESKKKVESFIKQEGIDYTVLLDTDNKVAGQYRVMGIPTNILLDKEGSIKYRGTSAPPEDLLPQK